MSKSVIGLAALVFAVAAPALQAQDASILSAGTRVRLVSPALDVSQFTGKVVSATRDTITFRADANPVTRALAVSDLSSIEISGGMETHRGRDALYGLVIGGAAGALAGELTYKKPKPGECFILCETRSGDALAGGIAGGLIGTLVGAFVVANFDKTERWVPLRKSASIQITPTLGGARVAFSRKF